MIEVPSDPVAATNDPSPSLSAIKRVRFEDIKSPTLKRLLEELRDDASQEAAKIHAYNRVHNRHNR